MYLFEMDNVGLYRSKKAIATWIEKLRINNASINDDLTVDVDGPLTLRGEKLKIIPIKFRNVFGPVTINNNKIKNIDWLPEFSGSLDIEHNQIDSYHNIHKIVDTIDGAFYGDTCSHLLGLLYIKKLRFVDVDSAGPISDIINKYLVKQPYGQRDVHSCQEELIESGFAEQARF